MRLNIIRFFTALGLCAPLLAFAVKPMLAAGSMHTVALKSDGSVVAWGYNGQFQLCDETNTKRLSPVAVAGLGAGESIGLAASSHTVSIRPSGVVQSCGANNFGQLGRGNTFDSSSMLAIPDLVDILVIGVSAGGGHTVALKSDGTLLALGYNQSGQLGDGTTTNRLTPVAVQGLVDVAAVSAGGQHTLALKSDGTVAAWGANYVGQLGNGTTTASLLSQTVPSLSGIAAVAAGSDYSLALKSDGTVLSWGSNTSGQLGDGTAINRSVPVAVVGASGVIALAAGQDHTVALRSDGTVITWGGNYYGQLGDGSVTSSLSPMVVPGLENVVAVSAGAGFTLALKADGTVVGWGYNGYGQLGDGTTTDRLSPVAVSGLNLKDQVISAITFATTLGIIEGSATVSATASSGLPITFTSATPDVCTVIGNNVIAVSQGYCSVMALQSGNADVNPIAVTSKAISAFPAFTVALTNPANLSQAVDSVAFTGSVVGNTGSVVSYALSLGGVNVALGAKSIAQSCNNAHCSTSFSLSFNWAAGSVSLGDQIATFAVTDSQGRTISVNRTLKVAGSQSITFGSVPVLAFGGGTGTVTATGGASGNAVTFTSTTPLICTVSGTNGSTVTALTAGNCILAANQAGNANYTAAPQATQTIVVSAGAQSVAFGLAPTLAVGGTGTVTATGGASGNPVTFTSTTPLICTVSGTNGSTVTALVAGNCVIAANQAGNANYAAAPEVTQTITIGETGLDLLPGWNLLGNASDQPVTVNAVFADKTLVNTVWKWDAATPGWQFYTPNLSAAELQTYADGKNYGVLTSINPGEGFWINASAKVKTTLPAFTGAAFYLQTKQLLPGWNLVATAAIATPAAFNLSLTDPLAPPPTTGTVPINLTTLWAWDNPLSKWYFYAPNLEGQGGTALLDYTAGKGYLDFTATGKTLGVGMGFWVNKP